jgi:hypothetical protein
MPGRKAKPPRLWFREDDGSWVILDRGRQIRTGCRRNDTDGAAQALEKYIGGRHTPTLGATDPRLLAIADVLTAYEISKRPISSDPRAIAQHELLLIRLLDLNAFFGARVVADIKAQFCRDFVDWSIGTPNENNRKARIAPREGVVSDRPRAAVWKICAPPSMPITPSIPPMSCRRSRCRRRRKAGSAG